MCILLHNTALMSPRLILAFSLSLALHISVLLPDALKRLAVAPPRPVLQASLRLPPIPVPEVPPEEPLLKNTFEAQETTEPPALPVPPTPPTPPAPPPQVTPPKPQPKAVAKREIQAAQRKLSQHLFYPTEAVERGIEGEVRLILKLNADGGVDEVDIAASSGHAILDNAAIKAAYAMGKLTGATSRELILPVFFQLQ